MKKSILESYQCELPLLVSIEARAFEKIKELLKPEQSEIHSFVSRLKTPCSLENKLGRPDRTYESLEAITDLIGIRIITFFEDTIDRIAARIEEAFEVDYVNSVDKRKSLDSSRFGYRSLHYVCRLKYENGSDSSRRYVFELQIRTILQHAWAEIEHDLGYKSVTSIPTSVRREFARVAGLLELADSEFTRIRNNLSHYSQEAKKCIIEEKKDISLDKITLAEFLNQSEVAEIEEELARHLDVPLVNDFFYPDYVIRMLLAAEVNNISRLRELFSLHRKDLCFFIRPYFEFTRKTWKFDQQDLETFKRGYSLVFLSHIIVVRGQSLGIERSEKLADFYQQVDYPDDPRMARYVAKIFLETMGETKWQFANGSLLDRIASIT